MFETFIENPKWLNPFFIDYSTVDDVPIVVYETINNRLDALLNNQNPQVSIIISAWNEEINLIPCLSSLSLIKSKYSFEIIVVNNNSTDRTQEVLNHFHITKLFQPIQGCGPARQMGLELAKGDYVLLADADCIYPENWVDELVRVLKLPHVVCTYGRYSFISEKGFPRWQLYLFERMKDLIATFRQIKHPYLNSFGISMGFHRELALKVGFIMNDFWGDDGKLCLGLMKYGKIKPMTNSKARVWTGSRTLKRKGSLFEAFKSRVLIERRRIRAHYLKF